MRAKVLVVPVYQKHWLYHVWSEISATEAAERPVHWMQGSSFKEKAVLFSKELNYKFNTAAAKQWKSLQTAEDGTFKNRLYRLARWVLSQEDPRETFLKSLPRGAASLEIIHPCTLKERLVRRRLRRMALAQEAFHNRRILGWALATLPQLPLVITPFPNVTLYFTAYKMVSHYQALQGCRTLRAAFERYDQEEEARRRAAEQRAGGDRGLRGGLASLLPLPRWRRGGGKDADADGGSSRAPGGGGNSSSSGSGTGAFGPWGSAAAATAPLPEFRSCNALDKAVRPLERWQSPLSDEAAARLEQLFHPPINTKTDTEGKTKGKVKTTTAKGRGDGGGGDGDAGAKGGGEVEAGSQGGNSGSGQLPELVARLRQQVLKQQQDQERE